MLKKSEGIEVIVKVVTEISFKNVINLGKCPKITKNTLGKCPKITYITLGKCPKKL